MAGALVASRRLMSAFIVAIVGVVLVPAVAGAASRVHRRCRPRPHADLRRCNFRGANLKGRSLRGADLAGDNLSHADLVGADLRSANFRHAQLSYADLAGAAIDRTNFAMADLRSVRTGHLNGKASLPRFWIGRYGLLLGPTANLAGEDLDSLPLDRLDLNHADLHRATLRGASLTDANLSGANLSDVVAVAASAAGANLAGANLEHSSWQSARLAQTTLAGADLQFGVFTHSVMVGANVAGARFTGANLADLSTGSLQGRAAALPVGWVQASGYFVGSQAELGYAQLAGQRLAGASLANTTLPNANLQNADLRFNTLSSSDLLDTNLKGSTLSAQSLAGAAVTGSQLESANLSGPSGTPVAGAPRSLPAGWALANQQLVQVSSSVSSGSNFNQGQWIEAPNGQFTVNMQSDGDLVEYQAGTAIWATGTSGPVQTVMQTDCNLVIYRAGEVGQPAGALYTTGTGGDPSGNCRFAVADDGSLSVTTSDGTVRWARYANGTLFTHRIQMNQNAPVYSSPSASSNQVGTIPQGASPNFVCWTTGPKVGNVDVYFYVLWQGVVGYYPSYYDNSVYASDSRISIDYGIPRCGSVPSTFTPPSNGTVVPPGPSTIQAPIDVFTATNIRPGPSEASGAALTVMPAGTNPGFLCWTTGQRVNNVNVWFKVYWAGVTGYYASGLDNSSYSSDLEIASKYGIPYCGGGIGPVNTPVATPPATPTIPPTVYDRYASSVPIRTCDSTLCPEDLYAGDGPPIEFPNGQAVAMLCWESSPYVGGLVIGDGPTSGKWFAVHAYDVDGVGYYDWIFSNNVTHQARVPPCFGTGGVSSYAGFGVTFYIVDGVANEITGAPGLPPLCPKSPPCGPPHTGTDAPRRHEGSNSRIVMLSPAKVIPRALYLPPRLGPATPEASTSSPRSALRQVTRG